MRRRKFWSDAMIHSVIAWGIIALLIGIATALVWRVNEHVYGDGSCMFVNCVKVTPITPVKP